MKQYYIIIKNGSHEVYGGDSKYSSNILKIARSGSVILPLGNRRPQNIKSECIKSFEGSVQ